MRGYYLNPKTFDVWLNYGNTMDVDVLFDIGDTYEEQEIKDGDKAYIVIRDKDDVIAFRSTAPMSTFTDERENLWAKFRFTITHEQSKTMLPDDYVWDFTYYTDPVDGADGFPIDGTVVNTPFCEIVRPKFTVRQISSREGGDS